ncbi:heterokaryon incompatibility protein-domain-containing protein [Aspergillus nidulans var. acristatus]
MEFGAIRKTTGGSKKLKVTGWDIQPGIGKDACTQFEVILPDASQAQDPGPQDADVGEHRSHSLHSTVPLKVVKHTIREAVFVDIASGTFRLVDHKLHIVLRAADGVEWSTSLELDSNQLIVPAQQAQLAELFIALCAACQSRYGAAELQLRVESPGPQACAAPFCEAGGLVQVHDGGQLGGELGSERDPTAPVALSYTENGELWTDRAPLSVAAVTDLLTSLAETEAIHVSNTCRASDQSWSILLPDNILWWTREITQEAPQRKHPKPANWGGIQDAWRNYKNLKESKKRASVLPPVVLTEAPRVHGSVMKFAQSGKPNGNTINPLRLIQVQTRDVVATAELETMRYAAISYTWSQVSKTELLESATTRAMELGYEYIWIDQYCIDQTNRQEKNAEIKRMRDYYKNATQVLVLLPDVTSLARFDVVSADHLIHVDAAINASRDVLKEFTSCLWLKRVWTFQEAWVAKQCVLCTREQMLDGTVIDALIGMLRYASVDRPRLMCITSKMIASPVVANPNIVVWDGCLRPRQAFIGSIDKSIFRSSFDEHEPRLLTLVQAWEASSGRDTVNEEDRVYALLSSVEGGDRVKVNRGRTLLEVIQDCVEAGIVTADLLAGDAPSSLPDRCWAPDLTGSGPQHPSRVKAGNERLPSLTWEGGRVSVKGKFFPLHKLSAWLHIVQTHDYRPNPIQWSEASDQPWRQFAVGTYQNNWILSEMIGLDFFLVQPMEGSTQTVIVWGKKLPDGSFHRKKGYLVQLKESGIKWMQDSYLVEIGVSQMDEAVGNDDRRRNALGWKGFLK